MPGVPLTYKTKQQILNNNDDEVAASPVSQNRMRFWDVHFINAAVALDYGNLSRLQGEKRRQVEELAQRMREDEDDSDVEYEDEDNSEDEKEEEDIDEGEEDETIQTATTTTTTSTTIPAGDTNDCNEPDNLLELEREFAINHRASILEYYELFYSIYNYQKELNTFIHDLTQGYYIQYTVESVLLDVDGRALLCESVWLYGVILMLMERLLPVSVHGANVVLFAFSEYAFSNLTYLTMF